MAFSKTLLIRTAAVCIIPLLSILYFRFHPAEPGSTQFLLNGIILACEATFLFKFVLFSYIGHHLRGERQEQKYTAWLFLPIILLLFYIMHYFNA
ncbi:MAG: hypothetical protein Q4A49_00705 [Neisseria sp.]|nr:hypothetical protein [Neisseria sp.]